MITVSGRELIIPIDERQIGTTYDNNSEVKLFYIDRLHRGIDISDLTFRLDLEYKGEQKDTCIIDKTVSDQGILLSWSVSDNALRDIGTVWISLRGFNGDGEVKWATNKGAFYVGDTVNTPGTYSGGLTELEQLEKKIEEKISETGQAADRATLSANQADAAATRANQAATGVEAAITRANQAAVGVEEAIDRANTAAGTVEQAVINANTAAQGANAAAGTINTVKEQAQAAAEAANAAKSRADTAAANASSKAETANLAAQAANAAKTNAESAAEAANAAKSRADTAATNADSKAEAANNAAQSANSAAETVNTAKEQAKAAAEAANVAAQAANAAKINADTATQAANTAAGNANGKATLANEKAAYAQTQGDYAKAQGEAAHEAASGDASDRTVNTFDAVTDEFPVIGNGKKLRNLFGTLKKFCEDFNNIRNGLITVGKLINDGLCTEEGYALDARFGKILKDQLDKQNSDLANKLDSSAIIAQYNKLQIGNVKIQYGKMECIVNFNGQASIVFPEGYSQENLYHCMAVPMSGSYAVRSITNSGNNNSLALLLDGNDQKPEYQSKIWMQYIVIGT